MNVKCWLACLFAMIAASIGGGFQAEHHIWTGAILIFCGWMALDVAKVYRRF